MWPPQLVSHWCRRNVVSLSCRWGCSQCVAMSRCCRIAKIKIFCPLHFEHSRRHDNDTTATRHGDLIVSTLCYSDTTSTFLRHFCDTIVSVVSKRKDHLFFVSPPNPFYYFCFFVIFLKFWCNLTVYFSNLVLNKKWLKFSLCHNSLFSHYK